MNFARVKSIFPAVPPLRKQRVDPGIKYSAPSTANNAAYAEALLLLEGEKAKLKAEMAGILQNPNLADKRGLIRQKRVELGYLDMQNHFDFQNYRGLFHRFKRD